MTYLADDIQIRRMARDLRNLSDDALGALHRNASGLGQCATESEMFRRIACKIPPTRAPLSLEQMLDEQAQAVKEIAA